MPQETVAYKIAVQAVPELADKERDSTAHCLMTKDPKDAGRNVTPMRRILMENFLKNRKE